MATGNGIVARGQGGRLWRQAVHAYGLASHLPQASLDQLGGGSRAIDKAARNIFKKYSDFEWFVGQIKGLLDYLRMDQWKLNGLVDQKQESHPDMLRWEAATEVLTDHLVEHEGDKDKALLIIVSGKSEHAKLPFATVQQFPFSTIQQLQQLGQAKQTSKLPLLKKQQVVLNFVEILLKRGAQPTACDGIKRNALHHAVKRGFKNVVSKLLENDGAVAMEKDIFEKLPLHLALKDDHEDEIEAAMIINSWLHGSAPKKDDKDEMAAMIVKSMHNDVVLKLFLADTNKRQYKAECSFQDIVDKHMKKTALAILDCMIDIDEDDQVVKLDYTLLESDSKGRSKKDPKFNRRDYTAFEKISLSGSKRVACHNLVKRYTKKKWNKFARSRFILKCAVFLLSVVFMTFAAVTGVNASDPTVYESSLDYARAASEVFVLLMVFIKACGEIYQMGRNRWYYLRDIYNYFDLASVFCLIAVVPLRWLHLSEQWQVFAMGYLIWIFDVFKYAAITSKNYAYYQILLRMIRRVFPQFTVVFVIVLVAFSGSFFLSLKGEDALGFHDETSAYHKVLFTGIRILIEGQPAVDYTGPTGYSALSTVLMCAFLFVTLVMLLNILIAQLSDTYNKVQQNIEGGLLLTRMRTITKLEINSVFNKCCDRKDPKLTEEMDLDDWNKFISVSEEEEDLNMRKIKESLASTEKELSSVKHELNNLDKMLRNVQTLLHVHGQTGGHYGEETFFHQYHGIR